MRPTFPAKINFARQNLWLFINPQIEKRDWYILSALYRKCVIACEKNSLISNSARKKFT